MLTSWLPVKTQPLLWHRSVIKNLTRVASRIRTSSRMAPNNFDRRNLSLRRGCNMKSLTTLVLFWCSLHLSVATTAEEVVVEGVEEVVVEEMEEVVDVFSEGGSDSKNHAVFNFAMQVVLFVLTKNFHIGAFLITALPLISLVKMSIGKYVQD